MGDGEKDSREFSRFKIPWISKGDKTRCKTFERELSQTVRAPGECVNTAESWTLPQRF